MCLQKKTIEVPKSFIQENKKNIINGDFLKLNKLIELDQLFKQAKKVYIIDSNDITKKSLLLKEVAALSSVLYEE